MKAGHCSSPEDKQETCDVLPGGGWPGSAPERERASVFGDGVAHRNPLTQRPSTATVAEEGLEFSSFLIQEKGVF
jgi:hypothetical protein